MDKLSWHLEKRKLSDLNEWEDNPRILIGKGIKDLANSTKNSVVVSLLLSIKTI
jgi:hypothetical protein